MALKNTPAYYGSALFTAVKRFIKQGPRLGIVQGSSPQIFPVEQLNKIFTAVIQKAGRILYTFYCKYFGWSALLTK